MSAPLTFPIRVRNPKTREMPMASSPPTTSHSTAMFPERPLKNPANGLRATEAPLRKPFVAKPPARVTWTFEIPPQRNRNPSAIRPKNIDQARPDFTSFPKTSSDHTLLSKSFSLETTVGYAPIGFTSDGRRSRGDKCAIDERYSTVYTTARYRHAVRAALRVGKYAPRPSNDGPPGPASHRDRLSGEDN